MPPLNSLLGLAALAVLALSSGPVQVNALAADRAQVARHVHAHDAVARRRRSDSTTSNGQCKPRPSSSPPSQSSTPPPSTPSSTPPPPASTPSSAPASTPTSTYTTGKKWGLAGTDTSFLANFAYLSKVGYYYDWSATRPDNLYGLEFVPMLWGWKNVGEFQNNVVAGYASFVLGMNEPNEPSQSNMSPQDGVSMWMQYINPLKDKGYTLISPACTDDQAGLDWYQQFFQLCQSAGCHVDAIAFHAYTTNATYLVEYATTLHDTYGMDIWITEFADQNFSGTGGQPSLNDVWGFAAEVTPFIDNTSWVKGAFPFGAMDDLQGVDQANNLQGSDGKPTDLGYFYFG